MVERGKIVVTEPKIKVRRLDIARQGANKWEFSINGKVSGRAPCSSSAISRAKAMYAEQQENKRLEIP